jgi:hypothetical protein
MFNRNNIEKKRNDIVDDEKELNCLELRLNLFFIKFFIFLF